MKQRVMRILDPWPRGSKRFVKGSTLASGKAMCTALSMLITAFCSLVSLCIETREARVQKEKAALSISLREISHPSKKPPNGPRRVFRL